MKYHHPSVTNEEQSHRSGRKKKKKDLPTTTKKCSLAVKRKSDLMLLASCLTAGSHSSHTNWIDNLEVISYILFYYPDHICPVCLLT